MTRRPRSASVAVALAAVVGLAIGRPSAQAPAAADDDTRVPGLSMGGQPDRWGYGVVWWVWEEPLFPGGSSGGPLQGAYTAMGAGGQYVTVLPAENMVVAHTTDIDANGAADVPTLSYDAILAMAIMSRCHSSTRC